jgi:DNA polymerase II small subunit
VTQGDFRSHYDIPPANPDEEISLRTTPAYKSPGEGLKSLMNEQERLQQALSLSLTAGYHLDKDAFDLLTLISSTEDPLKLVELALRRLEAADEKPFFINRNFLEETAGSTVVAASDIEPSELSTLPKPLERTAKSRTSFDSLAKNVRSDVKVLEDPTKGICSTGSIDEYLEYFQDRFQHLSQLLRQRMDSRSAGSLRDAFRAHPRSRVKVLCMVTEKRESKHGVFLKVEDPEVTTTVLIPQAASSKLLEKSKSILPDQVVCLCLLKGRKNSLTVEDLLLPDVPQRQPRTAREPVCVALISDLHVGSKEFMRDEFNRFTQWLNGKYGDSSLRDIASTVKYVVIAGDIVDGVGIYPNQMKELAIQDVFKQYDMAARFLEQIPEYIELIIIPGNHDATRKALPQPALAKEYAAPLYESRTPLSLGNPATVSIHGIRFLLYHGRSLDDVLATAVDMNFHSPERAMRLLLQSRHLAPSYGQRTLIAAERRDYLVIDEVPDIFHTGHVHVMKHDSYRGTLMVNSGAWQKQTVYQRNLGLVPTPAIIPVVNLQTRRVVTIDFNS